MSYESDGSNQGQLQIPIPWMREGEQVGAGDVVKRATQAVGIQPCGGCQRRRRALNRRIVFVGRRRRR